MEAPDLSPPHHIGQRGVTMRPESRNMKQTDGAGTVAYGLDDGLLVTFYEEPVFMEALSKNVGHQIFQGRIFTRIIMPGNRLTQVVHQTKGIEYEMAFDDDSKEYHTVWDIQEVCDNGDPPEPTKYPKAWAAFMRKGISTDVGVPIEEWGVVSRSYAASLKANNIHSVEMLAALTDQAAQGIMGAVKYRDLARAFLDDRKRIEIVARAQEKATKLEEQCELQARQIEQLQGHVMALQAKITGAELPSPNARMVGSQPDIAEQLGKLNAENKANQGIKKMSKKDAARKHKIPGQETQAA
jgi:hypothetical protein